MQASARGDNGDAERLVTALFTVVRRAGRLHHLHMPTPEDRATLGVLFFAAKNEPIRLSDLASALQLDPSTVSRQVRAMCDAGYLDAEEDPDDRRARLLRTTEVGRQVIREHISHLAVIIGEALSGWSARDRATLTSMLSRLADDLGPDPDGS